MNDDNALGQLMGSTNDQSANDLKPDFAIEQKQLFESISNDTSNGN